MPQPPDPRAAVDEAERKQLLTMFSGATALAMIAGGHDPSGATAVKAFTFAELFLAEAEKRYGKVKP